MIFIKSVLFKLPPLLWINARNDITLSASFSTVSIFLIAWAKKSIISCSDNFLSNSAFIFDTTALIALKLLKNSFVKLFGLNFPDLLRRSKNIFIANTGVVPFKLYK